LPFGLFHDLGEPRQLTFPPGKVSANEGSST
jgi:hypothetical protein